MRHLKKRSALGFLILLSLFTNGKLIAKAEFYTSYAAHSATITVHDSDDGDGSSNDSDDDDDDGDDDDDIDSMC